MADVLVMYNRRDDVPMIVTEEHIRAIRESCGDTVYWCGSEEEALEKGCDAEILFLWGGSGKVPETYCAQSKKLKWMNTFSAGYNPIMESTIWNLPIQLTNAKGVHGKTMAMTAAGYIISFLRDFPGLYRQQQKHIWQKPHDPVPQDAEGLTVCVLGAGAIGSEVARLSKAFGMHTIGVKRKVMALDCFDEVLPDTRMEEAVSRADFLVILTPLTPQTRHMVDAKLLSGMKSSAYLINIARGAVVDEEALIAALQNGTIAGAALDATEAEPLSPDSPLWDMENVIITPHCSADSNLYMDRAIAQFCENLRNYVAGRPLFNTIEMG